MTKNKQNTPQLVENALQTKPIVSHHLMTDGELIFERYICAAMKFIVRPLPDILIGTQFGGTKIIGEAVEAEFKADFFTGFSVVVPANQVTKWHFAGVTDVSLLYIAPNPKHPQLKAIANQLKEVDSPLAITDPLLSMCIQQIAQELFQRLPNKQLVDNLTMVALEQISRRLKPKKQISISPNYQQLGRIQYLTKYIQDNLSQPLTIKDLAALIKISPTHLRRIFFAATDSTVHQFIIHLRLTKARELLITTEVPLIQITTALGFNSQSHFIAAFRRAHSTTPARYRKLFAIIPTPTIS